MSATNAVQTSKQLQLLHRKSVENYVCAIKAQDNGYFNVAVSRLYYSCLLILKRCLIESGDYTEQDFVSPKGGSHVYIIDSYIQKLFPSLQKSNQFFVDIGYIRTLKDHRRDADYSPDIDYCASRTQKKYETCLKNARKCLSAIESIHNIKIINWEEEDEKR
ncbi:MAG: hypothetical protein PWP64_1056 [Candidatus Cloacimonadota bacterium]|nr:hypothetical protein [Candidatus Cloacimonadota bacterium]